MDLRQMEYLVTLADEQQFTRAAAICGVSQSGLSAAIRSLEEELGAQLFLRTTRRVEPTDAGRALLPHARTMLAQVSAARDSVTRATQEITGSLRVGAEQCLGIIDVVPLLERVHRRAPLLELAFVQAGSHDLAARVREGRLDIAFIATAEHLGSLRSTELGQQPLVVLVPPDHELADRTDASWVDLRDRAFVDFDEAWAIRSLNDSACAVHGISRRIQCTVTDVHTLLDLIHRGLGIAIVPAHVATKPQAAGLVQLSLPVDAPAWTVSAVSGAPSVAATVLLEMLRIPASAAA